MDKTADAVIIGGGILGASTAPFLAKKGVGKVVLLEKDALSLQNNEIVHFEPDQQLLFRKATELARHD